jgi:hypothetical protein
MYYMEHLLILLAAEKAQALQFRAGSPPVMVSEDEKNQLQGPPISGEDVLLLLRKMASSRQMRDLRECGSVQFLYTVRGRLPFLVRARMENENVVFEVS